MTRENAIPSQAELIRRELIKHGIKNGADLQEAISRLPALQIGIMIDPIKGTMKRGIYGRSRKQDLCG